ncbi:hypothetical protein JCM1840_004543 [Sporobolomyces johnsonii]
MRQAYTTADFTSAVASLERLGTQHGLGRLAESFVALWRAQLQRLGRSRSALFGPLDALLTGLHPLLEACFRDDDDRSVLDDAQWVWFTQGSRAHSRAPTQQAVERRQQRRRDIQGSIRWERRPRRKRRRPPVGRYQHRRQADRRASDGSWNPPPLAKTLAEESRRLRPISTPPRPIAAATVLPQSPQLDAESIASPMLEPTQETPPRTSWPPYSLLGFEGDNDEDEDDGGEGGNFSLGDAPPPNGSYLARITAAVGALASDGNTSFHLPDDVAAVHRAQQRRRLDLADRATKANFTHSMRLIASSLQLAYEDVLSIALGEYISFTTLRDSRLGSTHGVPEHLRVVYHLEERRSKPRTLPLDPYQWCQTFDTLERVLRIINVGEPFEEARQRRAAAYREFNDLELGRATSDAMRHRIVDYDTAIRSELARPVQEALVRHYGQCNDCDRLFQEIVLDPERRRECRSPPSVNSRSLPRPRLDAISGYCGRFVDGIPHSNCQWWHVCPSCQRSGIDGRDCDHASRDSTCSSRRKWGRESGVSLSLFTSGGK